MTLVHRRKVKLLGVTSFGARKTTIHLIPISVGLLKRGLGAFRGVFEWRYGSACSWVQLVKSAGS